MQIPVLFFLNQTQFRTELNNAAYIDENGPPNMEECDNVGVDDGMKDANAAACTHAIMEVETKWRTRSLVSLRPPSPKLTKRKTTRCRKSNKEVSRGQRSIDHFFLPKRPPDELDPGLN